MSEIEFMEAIKFPFGVFAGAVAFSMLEHKSKLVKCVCVGCAAVIIGFIDQILHVL